MMEKYPNLMVDLLWVAYESAICYPKKTPDDFTDYLIPKEEWIHEVILANDNQDRIILGSDLCGHFPTFQNPYYHDCVMVWYNILLDKLAEFDDVQRKSLTKTQAGCILARNKGGLIRKQTCEDPKEGTPTIQRGNLTSKSKSQYVLSFIKEQ